MRDGRRRDRGDQRPPRPPHRPRSDRGARPERLADVRPPLGGLPRPRRQPGGAAVAARVVARLAGPALRHHGRKCQAPLAPRLRRAGGGAVESRPPPPPPVAPDGPPLRLARKVDVALPPQAQRRRGHLPQHEEVRPEHPPRARRPDRRPARGARARAVGRSLGESAREAARAVVARGDKHDDHDVHMRHGSNRGNDAHGSLPSPPLTPLLPLQVHRDDRTCYRARLPAISPLTAPTPDRPSGASR